MENKKLPATGQQKIDVHCHLFNKKIASIPFLLDAIKSILKRKNVVPVTRSDANALGAVDDVVRIGRLLKMLFSNNEDALLSYLSKYEPYTIFVPLMFDLRFTVESAQALDTLKRMKVELQDELEIYERQNAVFRSMNTNEPDELDGFRELFNEIDEILNENSKDINAPNDLKRGPKAPSPDTFDLQYDQLIGIRNSHPAIIKPFFAVDARRHNVYEKMRHAIEKDGFTGVKMYCPNGYSPLDPRLDEVYRYCLDNDIPITAHCSFGGFATLENTVDVRGAIYKDGKVVEYNGPLKFKKRITQSGGVEERALALNHPDLWNVVLDRHKGLKLNLAHMGIRGSDDQTERYEWSNLIINMMLRHQNLYTDLSCMSERESIAWLWDAGSKADRQCTFEQKVTDRIMFGTDFWLNMLFKDMKQYMKDFETVFAKKQADLKRLQQTNPKRFLGLI